VYTKTRGVALVLEVNCSYCHKAISNSAVEVQTIVMMQFSANYYHFSCYNKARKNEE